MFLKSYMSNGFPTFHEFLHPRCPEYRVGWSFVYFDINYLNSILKLPASISHVSIEILSLSIKRSRCFFFLGFPIYLAN